MVTYANQKVIHIQKPKYEKNYLQLGDGEWQKASRILTYAAFKLYLYLADNKDGFDLALSQKAVEQTLDISKATYHTAVQELESRGYLILKQGNVYDFSPDTSMTEEDADKIKQVENHIKRAKRSCRQDNLKVSKQDDKDETVLSASTEINKQIINNIYKDGSEEANASSENNKEYNIDYDDDNTPYLKAVADKIVYSWCIKHSCIEILERIKDNVARNMDGAFGFSIKKATLLNVVQNTYNEHYEI